MLINLLRIRDSMFSKMTILFLLNSVHRKSLQILQSLQVIDNIPHVLGHLLLVLLDSFLSPVSPACDWNYWKQKSMNIGNK